jgi:cyclophilin family peptidyl-prolyl cis-trans isomerase
MGHWLHQGENPIIDLDDPQTVQEIEQLMHDYYINEYAASSIKEYIAEAYSHLMTSENGEGAYPYVSEYIQNKIARSQGTLAVINQKLNEVRSRFKRLLDND